MTTCGNRAKAARFRARAKQEAKAGGDGSTGAAAN
jgi:hypothetical protein